MYLDKLAVIAYMLKKKKGRKTWKAQGEGLTHHGTALQSLGYEEEGDSCGRSSDQGKRLLRKGARKSPFKIVLKTPKKQMKERRNKNLIEIGKHKSFIAALCQTALLHC